MVLNGSISGRSSGAYNASGNICSLNLVQMAWLVNIEICYLILHSEKIQYHVYVLINIYICTVSK